MESSESVKYSLVFKIKSESGWRPKERLDLRIYVKSDTQNF